MFCNKLMKDALISPSGAFSRSARRAKFFRQ